jgi:TPR repeat protein
MAQLLDGQQRGAALELLRRAAHAAYAPAVYQLGVIRGNGTDGAAPSRTEGFMLFKQAAAAGYRPAMLAAAQGLAQGDGAPPDCAAALAMLKRVTDSGPWAHFFDLDANRPHGCRKMVDINLTPREWLDSEIQPEAMGELLRIVQEAQGIQAKGAGEWLRDAAEGNSTALLWLALKAPIEDAKGWLDRLELTNGIVAVVAVPIRIWVIARGIGKMVVGKISEKEKAVVIEMLRPFADLSLILPAALCLMLMIVVRVNATFHSLTIKGV